MYILHLWSAYRINSHVIVILSSCAMDTGVKSHGYLSCMVKRWLLVMLSYNLQ